MSRIRSIHPNIWRDEKFVQLSEEARIVLLGLGTFSNYADRFHWDVDAISSHVGHPCADAVAEIEKEGLIRREGDFGQILFAFGFSRRRVSRWEWLRAAVFERDDYRCAYCGSDEQPLHCDHIVPVSKGGADDFDNLATACASCNLSKGSRPLETWKGRHVSQA